MVWRCCLPCSVGHLGRAQYAAIPVGVNREFTLVGEDTRSGIHARQIPFVKIQV